MEYAIAQNHVATDVAAELLKAKAIKLSPENPFTWASGWKSPIYCDNRLTLSYPALRGKIRDYLADLIKTHYPGTQAIAGVATAGIPQGALVAEKLGLPFLYVRSKPKGHGLENLIEGRLEKGHKLVVIEDLISTGGSSLAAVEALRQAGGEVECLMAIFNYGFDIAKENCQNAQVEVRYLSDYSAMLEEAIQNNYVRQEDKATLQNWRENPSTWGK